MPRFNLRDLLLATTLTAIGLGLIVLGADGLYQGRDLVAIPALVVATGCSAIGFGARTLFGRKVAFVVSMTIMLFFLLVYKYL